MFKNTIFNFLIILNLLFFQLVINSIGCNLIKFIMSDIDETKQCSNCKLEIPSSNYTIHTVHCQRNFYLCSLCEQPVNFNNKLDHDKTSHVVVQCTDCELELEKYLLDDHLKSDCPNRKVKCQICDIEIKAADIAEHENYCGSRTEKCGECGEFVMLKYKSLHLDSNHTFIKLSDEPGPSPSWQYGKRTLCNFLPDLTTKSHNSLPLHKRKGSERLRRSRNSGSGESTNDQDEINRRNLNTSSEKDNKIESKLRNVFDINKSARKDVDEWPALSSLRSLQISDAKCENATGSRASNFTQNEINEESDLFYALQVSQEINSDIWRKDSSSKDESLKNCFEPVVEKKFSTEKLVEKNMFEKNTKISNQEPKSDALRKDFNYLFNEPEHVELPCEFCGDLINSNHLILHQSRCSLYMSDSYSGIRDRKKTFHFDDDLEQKIACGVCNKFFKLSHLENHQLHCQRNPMKSSKNQDKVNYSKNLKAMNMKCEQGLQNGLEPSTPQLSRMGTRSEWLSELSKSNDEERNLRNNLSHPESGVITRGTKVSRKNRRAPSPPRR